MTLHCNSCFASIQAKTEADRLLNNPLDTILKERLDFFVCNCHPCLGTDARFVKEIGRTTSISVYPGKNRGGQVIK